uniref:Uncharacterized protein n=1 Tax=Medicago truncatula TaxID=3880 RepID=A2Q3R0_MEDTR|nr:hypothetical protein MtrDRAFT_AC155888g28v2 [Medicago truncatula]
MNLMVVLNHVPTALPISADNIIMGAFIFSPNKLSCVCFL